MGNGGENKKPLKFGDVIKSKRRNMGLSLRELAERTNISYSQLSKIERNVNTPTERTINALATALLMDKLELLMRANYVKATEDSWIKPYDMNDDDQDTALMTDMNKEDVTGEILSKKLHEMKTHYNGEYEVLLASEINGWVALMDKFIKNKLSPKQVEKMVLYAYESKKLSDKYKF